MIKLIIKIWTKFKHNRTKGNKENSVKLAKELIKIHDLKTHQDIGKFIDKKMIYKNDKLFGIIDTIQDLDYTVKRNYKGDCDDFSMLAYRLLEQINIKPSLITIVPLKFWKSHVLCLYKTDDKYFFISTNGSSANGPFNNLSQLFKRLKYKKVLGYYIDKRNL